MFFMIYKVSNKWYVYREMDGLNFFLFETKEQAEKVALHFEEAKIFNLEKGE